MELYGRLSTIDKKNRAIFEFADGPSLKQSSAAMHIALKSTCEFLVRNHPGKDSAVFPFYGIRRCRGGRADSIAGRLRVSLPANMIGFGGAVIPEIQDLKGKYVHFRVNFRVYEMTGNPGVRLTLADLPHEK